ncbi:hypothetical protein [Streptococcus acidominimus]|uniref:Uncharacterized protein n=1 Tax=Streptococcus acidominimus TaxID=1326 RepID=A0A4Y9FS89_STRAI|nr:hypothetical protein [Streptococcus acidominimus]MBF0847223.1 hypothetical protein [Streptococcus danieliae]MBF0818325.1 hypothetical protein [Streptococcus acidominimus]MBF0838846.1 hypothetical protein [Streptococcus acidominimus]MBF0839522.1 hypothetical protein [Streptococcus acidominimus]TFU31393.1 hypothetical protein E4U01_02475 [Streptococcus acidominimus]
MTRKLKQGLAEAYVFACFMALILSLMFLMRIVAIQQKRMDELVFEVEYLQQRNEIITQQLQEMNRYIQYPGG